MSTPWASVNCHRVWEMDASMAAVRQRAAPARMTLRGEKRFVHAVATGAPAVMRAAPRVPIMSIAAGEAPVKALSGRRE
jgi:hypothetical protein